MSPRYLKLSSEHDRKDNMAGKQILNIKDHRPVFLFLLEPAIALAKTQTNEFLLEANLGYCPCFFYTRADNT